MDFAEFSQKYDIQLNEQQKAAVLAVDGPVLLLAVPGSGKTTVLVSRIGYMILCRNIMPESILTVTYTIAATKDMRSRFEKKFGTEFSDRLEFRTINGISQKILQYFGRITGKTPFQVADKEASIIVKNAFRGITHRFPTENDIKNVQTAISYVKNMRLSEEQIKSLEVDVDKFPEIYQAYNLELRQKSLIDYDDQMVYAIKILESYPKVLEFFRDKYKYICVDEAQDTSKIQHDMINLLAGNRDNLFMVGDEDQSIYGFRAAYPQALVSFEKLHKNAKILLMESNYRSNAEIVEAADRLIQDNKNRHSKHIKATRPSGGKVMPICIQSRKSQYNYILKVAQDCDKETAVLYRNNENALPIIDMLERNQIPYRLKNCDMTFFSHPVVCDILDFISLAMNPYDGEAFMRIYYKMNAGISKMIATDVVENNRGKRALIDAVAESDKVSPFTRKQCRSLSTHFKNMMSESAGKAINRILKYMGYENYLEEHDMDTSKADILQILAWQEENVWSFPTRLDTLQQIIANGCGDNQSNLILSTIHSSKGLEYERVYMIDMLASVLPSVPEPKKNTADQSEINAFEEERRLYYVGMTRAKNELYIFTFGEGDTSKFSKTIFGNQIVTNLKNRNNQETYSINQRKKMLHENNYSSIYINEKTDITDYEMGVLIEHKMYGQGVVVKREGDFASIRFDHDMKIKKISLSYAVASGIVRTVE